MDSFYDNEAVMKYLEHMAYLNTISYCLLSGCGIKKYNKDEKSKFINIFINVGLYRKALPQYMGKPENPYDFSTYQWKDKKVKKAISPMVQALSIISMNLCARKILDGSLAIRNGDHIAYFFSDAGAEQLNFMYDNLLRENLLYVSKPKTDALGKGSLEIDEDSLEILPQYFAAEAAALTQDLLYKTRYDKKLGQRSKDALTILLPDLCHIAAKDSLYSSSRTLCQICDSLMNIYEYTDVNKALIHKTINILGQELCERVSSRGDILRKPDDSKISSFFTMFIALSCLSRLFHLCGFDNYLSCSIVLFKALCSRMSPEDGIFIKNEENKIEYSIKDIAAILSALKNFKKYAAGAATYDLDKMISDSFKNMILKSGIFVNQSYPILEDEKISLPKSTSTSRKSPPVFLERIEYKKSSNKFKLIDETFNAGHSLWACRQLL